ncbi:MAG: amidohydrolase family protein [marine benthic group bacterium]|jgi:imidazolonepropionase-like amidohydrolase|nr:amidohydrolase family protein [Candidatus Benthicola marisminoris]
MTGAVSKLKLAAVLILLLASACGTGTDAPEAGDDVVRVYRGATLVDGTGADPVENSVIVVRGDRIEAVGPADAIAIPDSAAVEQLEGMWVIPGLVDAHVHFGQSGWFDGRPDALDLRGYHPYDEVVSRLAASPELFSDAYLCSGVTSVFDVGGYGWTVDLQNRRETDARFVRVAATGPLLSTIDFWLNTEDDRQFIFMADSAAVRDAVRKTADRGAAAIKIWYIVPPAQDSAAVLDLVRYAARETKASGLPLVIHATGLWEATAAIKAGADVLVHGVFDVEVDDGFLELARDAGIIYVPTLTVTEGYLNVFSQVGMEGLPYPGACVDEGTRALLDSELPAEWRPPGEVVTRYGEFVATNRAIGIENLRRVHEAGITVAMGSDAGNPGTLHGPSIHYEAQAFQEAGMSAAEVLVAATRNAALAMGWGTELGTVEEGKLADFVVLRADPLADAANLREVARVVLGGRRVWPLE